MKNKFKTLKIRLLLEVFKNAIIAVASGLFAWYLAGTVFKKPIIGVIEWFGMDVLNMSRKNMQLWYDDIFRANENAIFGVLLAALVVFFLYRAFSRVTKYLNEINDAVDLVVSQGTEPIVLSDEIEPIAKKLMVARSVIAARSAQAVEAEQRKNDMVVYLAHDLKTPLTSVIGYLTLLCEGQGLAPAQVEKFADIALQKAFRLEDLINEMFDIARYNVQEMELKYSSFDFARMMEQIADEFSPILTEKSLTISQNLGEGLQLFADSDKLARVFDNLLKNAAAYAFEGSEISISATKEGENIRATIANRGATIPATALDAIFEKFYRVDESRGTKTGSAGLGLAISKEIILAHGGEISAKSNAEKTEFTVLLPISSEKSKLYFS